MPGQVQSAYTKYPDVGYPGQIAQAYGLWHVEEGLIHVPSNATRNPRPGDPVLWDATTNRFKIPTSAAENKKVLGILSYRVDTIPDAENILSYKDGDPVQLCVFGAIFVTAGTAMEYSNRIRWDTSDFRWDAVTLTDPPTTVAHLIAGIDAISIACVDRYPRAAGDIVLARVGYGRIY